MIGIENHVGAPHALQLDEGTYTMIGILGADYAKVQEKRNSNDHGKHLYIREIIQIIVFFS